MCVCGCVCVCVCLFACTCVFVCMRVRVCAPQLRLKFHKQQEEIRRLRELLNQRDVRIMQLELEINNVKNLHS